MIKDNYFTGQKLLKELAFSEPDDRTGVWLADVIGCTGKTGFFQTIIDEPEGLYLRIGSNIERMSANLRKKITHRLENNQGYPTFIWINFGRTVSEDALRSFADFGEQILDGMIDDNFGNTGGVDFMPLPYVNLIVTANTPPNLKQLTGDRIKLLTLFPIYDIQDNKAVLVDSILIPIYVEIRVRILKRFVNSLEYKFKVRLQDDDYVKQAFHMMPYYESLIENIKIFKDFKQTDNYKAQFYQTKLESEWMTSNPYKVQQDVLDVYTKALHHSTIVTGSGSGSKYIEASSFYGFEPRVYSYESSFRKTSSSKSKQLLDELISNEESLKGTMFSNFIKNNPNLDSLD